MGDSGSVDAVMGTVHLASTAEPDRHDQDLLMEIGQDLSHEDRKDLALLGHLTQALNRQQRIIGLESEVVERGRWNCDAASQLIDVAQRTSSIPFADQEQLHDLRPTHSDSETAPIPLAAHAKGKQRETRRPIKRSIYNLLPMTTNSWTGPKG